MTYCDQQINISRASTKRFSMSLYSFRWVMSIAPLADKNGDNRPNEKGNDTRPAMKDHPYLFVHTFSYDQVNNNFTNKQGWPKERFEVH